MTLRGARRERFEHVPRLAGVSGEPRIGKTRTAEELAAAARSRPIAVTWGACVEDEPSPLAPWVGIASLAG